MARAHFSKNKKSNISSSRLGKGLAALISEGELSGNTGKTYIADLPIAWISPNPQQPRMSIKPEELMDMADSIKKIGILEPLLVKKEGEKDYILIAGERRMRAAQLADQDTVPVVVMDVESPLQMLQIAIIENVQRKDLNPLEEASAYLKLSQDHNLSHEQIADTLGVQRVTVTNKIRLLKLPRQVKELIISEELSEGHGRALLGLRTDQSIVTVAHTVLKKQISVRATEELVRKIVRGSGTKKGSGGRPGRDFYKTEADYTLENQLAEKTKSNVKIERYEDNSGKLILRYKNQAQLEEFAEKLSN